MICPRCDVELKVGSAIYTTTEPDAIVIVPMPLITHENLQLVECWKCPSCGHSEDME